MAVQNWRFVEIRLYTILLRLNSGSRLSALRNPSVSACTPKGHACIFFRLPAPLGGRRLAAFFLAAVSLLSHGIASAQDVQSILTENGAVPSITGWNATAAGSIDRNESVFDSDYALNAWEISDLDGDARARWQLNSADMPDFVAGTDFRLAARLRVVGPDRPAGIGSLLEIADDNERIVLTFGKAGSETLLNFNGSSQLDLVVDEGLDGLTQYVDVEVLRLNGHTVVLVNDRVIKRPTEIDSAAGLHRVNFGDGGTASIGSTRFARVEFSWGDVEPCGIGEPTGRVIGQNFVDSLPARYPGGCAALTLVATEVTLQNISDFGGFADLQTLSANVRLGANLPAGLNGLDSLITVGGDLLIQTTGLSDLSGLPALLEVKGALEVLSNRSLRDISGLNALQEVNELVFISGNTALERVAGMRSFSRAGDWFVLQDNPQLTDVSGLAAMREVAGEFQVKNNASLDNCRAFGFLLDTVDDPPAGPSFFSVPPDVGGAVTLSSNNDGCNSIDAIVRDSDGDGALDHLDPFPDDFDNDGTPDSEDAFPEDPSESRDTDGDGVGDNADAFPEDPEETRDSDGDGVGDNADGLPNDPSEVSDSDGDGLGDNAEARLGTDPARADTDNDGFSDGEEAAFGSDPTSADEIPQTGISIPLMKSAADRRTS